MALHRLLREEEPVADLAVDEALPRRAGAPRSRAQSEDAPAPGRQGASGTRSGPRPGSAAPPPSGSGGECSRYRVRISSRCAASTWPVSALRGGRFRPDPSFGSTWRPPEPTDRRGAGAQLVAARGSSTTPSPSRAVACRILPVAEPERDVVGPLGVAVDDQIAAAAPRPAAPALPAASCCQASRGTSRPRRAIRHVDEPGAVDACRWSARPTRTARRGSARAASSGSSRRRRRQRALALARALARASSRGSRTPS